VILLALPGSANATELPVPKGPWKEISLDEWKKKNREARLLELIAPYLPVKGAHFSGYRERRRAFRYVGRTSSVLPNPDLLTPVRKLHVLLYEFPSRAAARLACSWLFWERSTAGYARIANPFDPALHPPWTIEKKSIKGKTIWYWGRTESGRYPDTDQLYFWPTRDNALVFLFHSYFLAEPTGYLARLVERFPPAGDDALIRSPARWLRRAGPALIGSLADSKQAAIRSRLDQRLRNLVLAQPDLPPPELAVTQPAEAVRRWRSWWRKHGSSPRIDWCRRAVDALLADAVAQGEAASQARALMRLLHLVRRLYLITLAPPGGVSLEELDRIHRLSPPDEATARVWKATTARVARLLAGWWKTSRPGKPLDWYHAYLRLLLRQSAATTWRELDAGLRNLEVATLGGYPAALRRTRRLPVAEARRRYTAWRRWLDGPGRTFQPELRATDRLTPYRVDQVPWLAPLLKSTPSRVRLQLSPTVVDRNRHPLIDWLTPLREADFKLEVASPGQRYKRPKMPGDVLRQGAALVSLHLHEYPRKSQYRIYLTNGAWIFAKEQARREQFSLPETVRWGDGGVTLLVRARRPMDQGLDAKAFWLARSGPDHVWLVMVQGPLARCEFVGRWVQQHFPSIVDSIPHVADYDRFHRELMDWTLEIEENPRWGAPPGESAAAFLRSMDTARWVQSKGFTDYFTTLNQLRAFWKTNRSETAADRFRRNLDRLFDLLKRSKGKLALHRRNFEFTSVIRFLQGAARLPSMNDFPIHQLVRDEAALDKAIEDWLAFWNKSRRLPRDELARALVDQHIRWLSSPSLYIHAQHVWQLFRPYLPRTLRKQISLGKTSSKKMRELSEARLAWWRANKKNCFRTLPPWFTQDKR